MWIELETGIFQITGMKKPKQITNGWYISFITKGIDTEQHFGSFSALESETYTTEKLAQERYDQVKNLLITEI